MTATDWLRDLLTVEAAATPGPWYHEPYGEQNQNGDYSGGNIYDEPGGWHVVMEVPDGDGALIVEARNNLQPLTQALLDVLELHQPVAPYGQSDPERHCSGCNTHITFTLWPCSTVQAIIKHLGGDDE